MNESVFNKSARCIVLTPGQCAVLNRRSTPNINDYQGAYSDLQHFSEALREDLAAAGEAIELRDAAIGRVSELLVEHGIGEEVELAEAVERLVTELAARPTLEAVLETIDHVYAANWRHESAEGMGIGGRMAIREVREALTEKFGKGTP